MLLCLKTPEAEVELQLPEVLQDHPANRTVVDSRILLRLRCSERLALGLISIFPSCKGALRVSVSFKEKQVWCGSAVSTCKHLPCHSPPNRLTLELRPLLHQPCSQQVPQHLPHWVTTACAFLRVTIQTQLGSQAALPELEPLLCVHNPHGCVTSWP